jgi:hypothetical protein
VEQVGWHRCRGGRSVSHYYSTPLPLYLRKHSPLSSLGLLVGQEQSKARAAHLEAEFTRLEDQARQGALAADAAGAEAGAVKERNAELEVELRNVLPSIVPQLLLCPSHSSPLTFGVFHNRVCV